MDYIEPNTRLQVTWIIQYQILVHVNKLHGLYRTLRTVRSHMDYTEIRYSAEGTLIIQYTTQCYKLHEVYSTLHTVRSYMKHTVHYTLLEVT